MSLFGQSYEEYTDLYASGSSPIVPSDKYLGIITVLLIIVGKYYKSQETRLSRFVWLEDTSKVLPGVLLSF